MRVGSKGRYAVTAIIYLVQQDNRMPMPLAEIAKLHEISLSYLEQIFSKLRRAGLVKSVRGPGGGYLLDRPADKILISDIVAAVEEPTSRELKSASRSAMDGSETLALWDALGNQVFGFLSSISVADVCERRIEPAGQSDQQVTRSHAAAS
ncbi:MAG: Rrf2 family transcriptional regulator [Rhodospirillaceae bacterium]|nr:Rrf2 family transcriptional regulator [Rhodospirillaceae bacterium]|tara:strand:+ start:27466 stop:27918 length:453 start_codon:yes stop_codon:yes gene_type:complete